MGAGQIRPKKLVSLGNSGNSSAPGAARLSAHRQGNFDGGDGLARREFLRSACAGLLCGVVAGCGAAGNDGASERVVTLPPAVDGRIRLSLGEFPQLREVGGGLVGRAPGVDVPIAVAHLEQGKFMAITAVCSHMATTLNYNSLNGTLDCPAHGSSFELDGRVINGPAKEPLRLMVTEFDGQLVDIVVTG
jgi:nitrite reductase/ring-hydroxylating ferredoxin subunit